MRSDVVESQIVAMFAVDLGDDEQFITFVGVPGGGQAGRDSLFVFLLFVLYWTIANEQCCDGFRWPTNGLSHTYTGIHCPLNSPPIQAATSH